MNIARKPPLAVALLLSGSAAALLGADEIPSFDAVAIHRTNIVGVRQIRPDSVRMQGTLATFIGFAYDRQPFQITGGPDWAYSPQELFDIEAKASAPFSNDVIMAMLRRALRDRFRLRTHEEPRQSRVYLLGLAKGRVRLKATSDETPHDGRGAMQMDSLGITGRGVSMQLIARFASASLATPVLDRTGQTGFYDFDFKSEETDRGALAFDLLQSLGLRLQKARQNLPMLVIDAAAKPDDN